MAVLHGDQAAFGAVRAVAEVFRRAPAGFPDGTDPAWDPVAIGEAMTMRRNRATRALRADGTVRAAVPGAQLVIARAVLDAPTQTRRGPPDPARPVGQHRGGARRRRGSPRPRAGRPPPDLHLRPGRLLHQRQRLDGRTFTEALPKEQPERLKTMYRLIGGDCRTVELVALSDQFDMWVDEEGLYTQRPNTPTTMLAQRFGLTWQTYHGTTIITGPELPTGPASLVQEQVAQIGRAHV